MEKRTHFLAVCCGLIVGVLLCAYADDWSSSGMTWPIPDTPTNFAHIGIEYYKAIWNALNERIAVLYTNENPRYGCDNPPPDWIREDFSIPVDPGDGYFKTLYAYTGVQACACANSVWQEGIVTEIDQLCDERVFLNHLAPFGGDGTTNDLNVNYWTLNDLLETIGRTNAAPYKGFTRIPDRLTNTWSGSQWASGPVWEFGTEVKEWFNDAYNILNLLQVTYHVSEWVCTTGTCWNGESTNSWGSAKTDAGANATNWVPPGNQVYTEGTRVLQVQDHGTNAPTTNSLWHAAAYRSRAKLGVKDIPTAPEHMLKAWKFCTNKTMNVLHLNGDFNKHAHWEQFDIMATRETPSRTTDYYTAVADTVLPSWVDEPEEPTEVGETVTTNKGYSHYYGHVFLYWNFDYRTNTVGAAP